jgi:hypothetical protein
MSRQPVHAFLLPFTLPVIWAAPRDFEIGFFVRADGFGSSMLCVADELDMSKPADSLLISVLLVHDFFCTSSFKVVGLCFCLWRSFAR